MTWIIVAIVLLALWTVVFPLALLLFMRKAFADLYAERFDELAEIVAQAMAQRDAVHQKFRAEITKLMVTDTQIFDVMLEDPSDLPIPTLAPTPEEVPDADSPAEVPADAE